MSTNVGIFLIGIFVFVVGMAAFLLAYAAAAEEMAEHEESLLARLTLRVCDALGIERSPASREGDDAESSAVHAEPSRAGAPGDRRRGEGRKS